MKIAINCFDYNDHTIRRQPWRFVWRLGEWLEQQGHEVVVFQMTRTPSPEAVHGGLRTRWLDASQYYRILPRLLHHERFHLLIDVQGMHSAVNLFKRKGLRSTGMPVVGVLTSPSYSLREVLGVGIREWMLHASYLWRHLIGAVLPPVLIAHMVNKVNHLTVVLSHRNKRRLVSKGALADRVVVILPGREILPSSLHQDSFGSETPIGKRRFRLLYLGSPLTLRGSDVTLKALSLLHSDQFEFLLVMLLRLESESLRSEVRRLQRQASRMHINGSVVFVTGVLEPPRVAEHICSADIVLQPFKIAISDVPLGILEGLAAGKLVISTDTDGIPELLEDGRGLTVRPNDPHALAQAIKSFAADPSRAMSCKAAGFKYMSEQHPPWLETFSALVDPLGKIVGGANKTQTNTRRNPRARVFCFSGVDGVGKSFLLNKVQVLIRSAGYRPTRAWLRYNHYFTKLVLGLSRMMGLTVIQCVGARVVHKHHRFQSTPFVARLFLFTKVLDTYITWILKIWLPTHLDRKKIILCDRYIYDILVDLMVETGIADLENTLAGELLLWLCGEPTETIILTAPRELLLARRSENALDPYLDYRISLYSAFADKHCLPKIVSIDPEQSLNEAIQRTSLSGYIKKGHQTSNPNH